MQLPPTLGHLALLGCPRDRVSEPIPTKCLEAELGCGFRLGGQLRGLAVLRTWQGWGRGDVRSQSETRVDSPLLPPTHNLTSFNNIVNGGGEGVASFAHHVFAGWEGGSKFRGGWWLLLPRLAASPSPPPRRGPPGKVEEGVKM